MPDQPMPTPAPPPSGTVTLETQAEESDPFILNPAFLSLRLPPSVFKKEVGGQPS
jgi:hypothetical protein